MGRAIRSARANGFIHNEAIAYEHALRSYVPRGFDEIAHLYLQTLYRHVAPDGTLRQDGQKVLDTGP